MNLKSLNYMIKKILILIICSFLPISAIVAQNYIVFKTVGNVAIEEKLVEEGNVITSDTKLRIDKDSELMLIDEQNNKMVTIKGSAEGKLTDILKTINVSLKNVTSKYVSYMKQKLNNKNNDNNYMQSAGTSYRETDSIAKQKLSNLGKK